MINRIRKILLILVFGIVGLSTYYLITKSNTPIEKIALKTLGVGIDIEIENFKVVHEVSTGEKWELTADLAQVDQKKDLTRLTNVKLIIRKMGKQKLWVGADSGSIQNENKDLQLEGNVRMIGTSKVAAERVGKNNLEAEQ